MGLASKLAFQFDRKTQVRGQGLFHSRAVRFTDASPDHAYADVADGRLYDVRMALTDNGRLSVKCTCPSFRGYLSCTHIWAAVLEADREGVLVAASNERYLKLLPDGKAPLEVQPVYGYGRRSQPIPPPPQIPPWQEHLSAIRQGLEEKRREPQSWPPGLEIVYAVDVPASKSAGVLVLSLFSRSRKKNGEFTQYKEFRVSLSRVDSLPDPLDAEIISLMLGGVDTYSFSYAYNTRYSASVSTMPRKALPHLLAMKLIPMASAAKRLRVHAEAGSADLLEATWDDLEPWKLWLEVRQDDRDQWNITGSLRRGEERMEVTEPLLILESGLLLARGKIAAFRCRRRVSAGWRNCAI